MNAERRLENPIEPGQEEPVIAPADAEIQQEVAAGEPVAEVPEDQALEEPIQPRRLQRRLVRGLIIAAGATLATGIGVGGWAIGRNTDFGSGRNSEIAAGTPTPRPNEAGSQPEKKGRELLEQEKILKTQQAVIGGELRGNEEAQCKTANEIYDARTRGDQLRLIAELLDKPLPTTPAYNCDFVAPIVTPKPVYPEVKQQPDWTQRPVTSEIFLPNDGTTTINRALWPNQIIAISGGPMTIGYMDQYGHQRLLSYPGGPDRVTLAFFLGDQRQINAVNVKGVIPFHNWVGTYSLPDQNPQNPQNWQALMNAKAAETMRESTSIPGGAPFVDVIVVNGGDRRLVLQQTFIKP